MASNSHYSMTTGAQASFAELLYLASRSSEFFTSTYMLMDHTQLSRQAAQ